MFLKMNYKDRLFTEIEEIEDKILKLSRFINSAMFRELDPIEKSLLEVQLPVMKAYKEILEQRAYL
jgi:hypothetical protein